ncbi:MAG: hypothetical protein GX678_02785, partial [Actinomycetales bacterium]|nr:hypothetical protein [Actinomycetales bacterium]
MSLTAPARIMPRLLTALALVFALVTPAAMALPAQAATDGPKITLSKATITGDEEVAITVTGTGFDPALATSNGAPSPIPAGDPAGVFVVWGAFPENWKPSAGASGTARTNVEQKWAVAAENLSGIGGSAAGAVELKADGSFETTFTVSKALLKAKYSDLSGLNPGVYTYAGLGSTQAQYETSAALAFADAEPGGDNGDDSTGDGGTGGNNGDGGNGDDTPPVVAEPSVTVSKTKFIGAEEAVVTVAGKNFDPSLATGARPPLAGKPAGAYVVFGAFADEWQPSKGAGSSTRPVNAGQKWAVSAGDMGTIGGANAGAIELKADGSFTAELTVSKALLEAKRSDLTGLNPGIYTYPGSGATQAKYETFTPIEFVSSDPSVTVSKVEFEAGEEAVVTVDGKNFDPSLATGARPPLAGKPAGAYVVFGAFADEWQPSKGAGSSTRPVNAGQKWAVSAG